MHRRLPLLAAAFAATSLAALPAQKQVPLGTNGWHVQLPATWRAHKEHEGYGDYQFTVFGKRGFFGDSEEVNVVVREWRGVLRDDADYRRAFEALDPMPKTVPMQLGREADWLRITRAADDDDADWAYRSELLVIDGGALNVLGWADPDDAKVLTAKIEEFLDAILIPGKDSPWQKGLVPVADTLERGNVQLSVSVRPFVWRRDDQDELRGWHTFDGQQFLYVNETARGSDGERVLDREVRRYIAWDATFRERSRGVRTIDGIECRELIAASQHYQYHMLFVPLGGQRWLHVRYVATGAEDRPNKEREAVLTSLRLKTVDVAAVLPALPPAPRWTQPVSAMWRAFLAGASPRLSTEDYPLGWALGANGEWVTWSQDRAQLFAVGASRSQEWDGIQQGVSGVVHWRGQWLGAGYGGEVRVLFGEERDGEPPFRASHIAIAGDDLLCLRAEPATTPWAALGSGARTALLLRRHQDGNERVVTRVDEPVVDMVSRPSGGRALLQFSGQDGSELTEIDLATGERRRVGEWSRIGQFGVADDGWLVNGQPKGAVAGVWYLRDGQAPELLVSGGEALGIHLANGQVWFAHGAAGNYQLSEVTLAHCRRSGAAVQPFTWGQLDAVGDALLASQPKAPNTGDEVLATVKVLRERARAATGHDLPADATSIYALVDRWGTTQPGVGGRIVMALLFAGDMLANGGRWIAGSKERGERWEHWLVANDSLRPHTFALASHVPALVVGTRGESYDALDAADFTKYRHGRQLLVGVDPVALQAAHAASVPEGFAAALQAGDTKTLCALAAAVPANTMLRKVVQDSLASREQWRELEEFSREHAAAKDARAEDTVAWLLARAAQQPEGAGSAEVLAALQAAVARHPREEDLYWLLGQQHERAGPDGRRAARACYDRVVELQPYGNLAEAAKSALQRLDGAGK